MRNHYHSFPASPNRSTNQKNNSTLPKRHVIQSILSFAGAFWISKSDYLNGETVEQFLN